MSDALLTVEGLSARYGHLRVVHDVSFDVVAGAVTCLIGANGAGKSTILRSLTGQHRSSSGSVQFDASRINGIAAHRIARRRIAIVPEGRRVFASLTVLENLQMGEFPVRRAARSQDRMRAVFELFPELDEFSSSRAGLLSGGQQQMLAIGRAIMSDPRLLILDEPSMGLSPRLVQRIYVGLNELKKAGTTILLAEQNARLALQLSEHAYVLERGHVVEQGRADALRTSPRVERIYLGG
jgi:branched-chain amino acid transport system ATP-binding protein